MRAQQRTSGLRRVRPNPLGVQLPAYALAGPTVAGTAVLFSALSPGLWTTFNFDGFTLNGVPPISGGVPGNLPITADFAGGLLRLIYAAPLTSQDAFYIPDQMQELRGQRGEFIAPGIVFPFDYVPPGTDSAVTAGVATGSDAVLTLANGAELLFISGLGNCYNVTTAEQPTNWQTVAGQCIATFATAPSPGDQINFYGGAAAFLNSNRGTLLTTSVVLV